MTEREVRSWLGLYFLILTGATGGYILLFADTRLLPGLTKPHATGIFEIIVPVLVAQLAIIFKWYGGPVKKPLDAIIDIPQWVVKGPPVLVACLLSISILMLVLGNNRANPWGPSPEAFAALVTFCVTILNTTTVVIVGKYFEGTHPRRSGSAPRRQE